MVIQECQNRASGCHGVVIYPEKLCPDCKEAARLLSQAIEEEDEKDTDED